MFTIIKGRTRTLTFGFGTGGAKSGDVCTAAAETTRTIKAILFGWTISCSMLSAATIGTPAYFYTPLSSGFRCRISGAGGHIMTALTESAFHFIRCFIARKLLRGIIPP